MENRREFTRVPLHFSVNLEGNEDKTCGEMRNLSLRGLFLVCDQEFEIGETCELRLELGTGDNAIQLGITGKVARMDEDGIGVEFISLDSVDTLGHLQNLVLYNSGNPEQTEQEIRQHTGIQRNK